MKEYRWCEKSRLGRELRASVAQACAGRQNSKDYVLL
jgi:hypothetical protein